MLPLLSEFVKLPFNILKESLINVYLEDTENNHSECIYLYFNYNISNPEFTHFENELTKNDLFVESYDGDNTVLYVLKFPEEYKHEYYSYKRGEYSKFNVDAQLLIIKFLTEYLEGLHAGSIAFLTTVKQIFNKSDELREKMELHLKATIDKDAELEEMYNKKNETFNLNIINEYANKNKENKLQSPNSDIW